MEKLKRYLYNKNRIYAIGFLVLSVLVYIEANTFPQSMFDHLGSGIFPQFLAIVIGGCSILQFLTAKPKQEKKDEAEAEAADAEVVDAAAEPMCPICSDYLGVLYVVAEFVAYVLLFNIIGFILDTILFLMMFILYFDKRPIKRKVLPGLLFSVVFTAILYLLFGVMLKVLLPTLLI